MNDSLVDGFIFVLQRPCFLRRRSSIVSCNLPYKLPGNNLEYMTLRAA